MMKDEKSEKSNKEDEISIAPADQAVDTALERLPTQFREEILKQYELPTNKVSILTIFRYATPLEFAMQVTGILMAIAAGIFRVERMMC
jgi:hypothetical protein